MKNYLKVFKNKRTFFRAVVAGSSLTAQDYCHPNWVDFLNFTFRENEDWDDNWRRKIINSGRDGATLRHFIKYFDQEIAFYKPHVVIFSAGLMAIQPKLDKDEFEHQLEIVFDKIKKIDSDLIAWSPYPINKKRYHKDISTINQIYKKLSEKYDAVYIDMFSEFKKYDPSKIFTFISDDDDYWNLKEGEIDYLHCNVVGNQIIADKIAKEAFNTPLNDWEFGTMKLIGLEKYKK